MKQHRTDSSQATGHRSKDRCQRCCPSAADSGLQQVLWISWTSLLLGCGYLNLRPALHSDVPVDILGLISSMLLVGALGLVAITLIEQRLEPWRFLSDDEEGCWRR